MTREPLSFKPPGKTWPTSFGDLGGCALAPDNYFIFGGILLAEAANDSIDAYWGKEYTVAPIFARSSKPFSLRLLRIIF